MSNKAITWAGDMPVRGNAMLVLIFLADHARKHDTCFPGIDRIVEKCGISRHSAIRHVKDLTELGIISKERQPYSSSLYQLNIHLKPEAVGGVS